MIAPIALLCICDYVTEWLSLRVAYVTKLAQHVRWACLLNKLKEGLIVNLVVSNVGNYFLLHLSYIILDL